MDGSPGARADSLTTAAAALDSVADDPQQARGQVHALLADLDEQQQLLNPLLAVRPKQDQAAGKQQGALLSSIYQLRMEIASAAIGPGLESDLDLIGAGGDRSAPPALSVSAGTHVLLP